MNVAKQSLPIGGLAVSIQRVPCALRDDGSRADLIYVALRPEVRPPGIDAGPRVCLALTPVDAARLGALLQQSAKEPTP